MEGGGTGEGVEGGGEVEERGGGRGGYHFWFKITFQVIIIIIIMIMKQLHPHPQVYPPCSMCLLHLVIFGDEELDNSTKILQVWQRGFEVDFQLSIRYDVCRC